MTTFKQFKEKLLKLKT